MTPLTATQLKPGDPVRLLRKLTGYYYDSAAADGTGCIDCVYAGTVGRVVAVPENDEGATVLVDFGNDGHWQVWASELETA